MNNKIKFLRGTSNEYAVAEKDNDTIYFTTDDGKLYIGDKEISGSDIIIDDTLSETSENPVQNKVVTKSLGEKALKAKYNDYEINVGRKADTTVGSNSAAIGYKTEASGNYAFAEGNQTVASGKSSHAEGENTVASGNYSHAEGYYTEATGNFSHATGQDTKAMGGSSYAGGDTCEARKFATFVHGEQLIADHYCEAAFGRGNQSNADTLFSIGDGNEESDGEGHLVLKRHNAFEVTIDGGKLHDKDIATIETATITLSVNNWTDNTQIVSVSIVTSDCIIIISPAPDSQDEYSSCGIKCTSQSDGSLVFSCNSIPSINIDVNIVTI